MKTKSHQIYKLADGSRTVGVTTVVGIMAKPALVKWANNLGLKGIDSARYVDDKADIGTLAHEMVVNGLLGEPVDTYDYSVKQIEQAEWAYQSFKNWKDVNDIEIIWGEKAMVSEEYKFGGQADIYAYVKGHRELIDIKTSSGIYDDHKIQVAGGYGILLKENGHAFDRVRILNIPRANNESWGEVIIEADQTELYEEIFLACLDVYNLKKKLKGDVVYPKKHGDKTADQDSKLLKKFNKQGKTGCQTNWLES